MALRPAEWDAIRDDRVADLIGRWADLPAAYHDWVKQRAWNIGLPKLRMGAQHSVGEVASWEGLVFRCEQELAYRASQGAST